MVERRRVVRKWKGNNSGNGMDFLGRGLKHEYSGKANRQGRFQSRGSEEVRGFSKRDRDCIQE
jgi:hypothetical protein